LTLQKTQEANNELIKEILLSQVDTLCEEPDGVGTMAINYDDKYRVERSLDNYQRVLKAAFSEIDKSKFIGIHTRFGTKGDKSLYNVHFFNKDNLYMAHNGVMSQFERFYGCGHTDFDPYTRWDKHKNEWLDKDGFSKRDREKQEEKEAEEKERKIDEQLNLLGAGDMTPEEQEKAVNDLLEAEEAEEEAILVGDDPQINAPADKPKKKNKDKFKQDPKQNPSDTLEFLLDLPKNITQELLEEKCSSRGEFNGKAVLIDVKKKEVWHFSTTEYWMVTDYKTFTITFSYEPMLKKTLNLFGWAITAPEKEKRFTLLKVQKGIYKYSY
jgi:hypothetical protein